MTERLLQYIWQFQYFNKNKLSTIENELVEIIRPGSLNNNQGPDFLNAQIRINNTVWAGNIELHIKSSDWLLHKHSSDKNYQNIILHVVWENDIDLDERFPVITLQDKVSKLLLNKYDDLMDTHAFIACENAAGSIDRLTWQSWKERLLIERLEQRSAVIFQHLSKNNYHWEETFWWLIARNFGIKVNADAFEQIANSLSINILAKNKNQIHQVEALLFGQAGLLNTDFEEKYPQMLKKEYAFLAKKYSLESIKIPLHFLRMRPSNFPTIRLAQLAALIHKSQHLFSAIKEIDSYNEVALLLNITANDYWHYHYMFDEPSGYKEKNIGKQMINNIMINTIAPILFGYGQYHNKPKHKLKVLEWLERMPAENNSITNAFIKLNITNKNAFDSQALIQLKNEYCNNKRCLECSIGNKLLKGL
ncbi:MAG: DUF2851 family protein [Bacteroidota bacterium]